MSLCFKKWFHLYKQWRSVTFSQCTFLSFPSIFWAQGVRGHCWVKLALSWGQRREANILYDTGLEKWVLVGDGRRPLEGQAEGRGETQERPDLSHVPLLQKRTVFDFTSSFPAWWRLSDFWVCRSAISMGKWVESLPAPLRTGGETDLLRLFFLSAVSCPLRWISVGFRPLDLFALLWMAVLLYIKE